MSQHIVDDPAMLNFIRRALERLRQEFRGILSHETIQRFVDEPIASLSAARVKEFVPLFVNRFARERLRALAQVQGSIAKDVQRSCSCACTTRAAARWRLHYIDGRVRWLVESLVRG